MDLPIKRMLAVTGSLTAAAAALPATGVAATAPVASGGLDWTIANVYDSAAPQGTDRTWLGYDTGPPPLAAGSATPSAGATGDTVNLTSPRGRTALNTFSYSASGGSYDAAAGAGTIETKGTVTFLSQAHGYEITVTNPVINLDGAVGQIFASGKNTTGTKAYTRTDGAIFDLDLSAAQVSDAADGTRTIAGIVPRIATTGVVFPAGERGYPAGAGPDRTPNTFGSFTVRVKTKPPGADPTPAGPSAPDSAPALAQSPRRTTGTVQGARRARRVVVRLEHDLGNSARRTLHVRLLAKGRTVAKGSLRDRLLRLTVARTRRGAYPRIKGVYTLRPLSTKTKLRPTRLTVR